MEVELQVLKHLAREAHPTVAIIDEYDVSKTNAVAGIIRWLKKY